VAALKHLSFLWPLIKSHWEGSKGEPSRWLNVVSIFFGLALAWYFYIHENAFCMDERPRSLIVGRLAKDAASLGSQKETFQFLQGHDWFTAYSDPSAFLGTLIRDTQTGSKLMLQRATYPQSHVRHASLQKYHCRNKHVGKRLRICHALNFQRAVRGSLQVTRR
jgi:hypothetical protein